MKNLWVVAVVAVITVVVSGCVQPGYLTSDQAAGIPVTARSIEILSDLPAEDLYVALYKVIIADGNRMASENKEMLTMATEGKGVGESVIARMTVVIESTSTGSKATIWTEWKPGHEAQEIARAISGHNTSYEWMKAKWSKKGRSQRAFAYAASLAKKVPGKIIYR